MPRALFSLSLSLSRVSCRIRLASEAARYGLWEGYYFDYKAAKKSIKESGDAQGAAFHSVLVAELSKVSSFYADKAHALELMFARHGISQAGEELSMLRIEVQELIKVSRSGGGGQRGGGCGVCPRLFQ